mgnify:CR=1 FL=1
MCLAVPARIDESLGPEAWVRIGDARVRVDLSMTPEAGLGDWVLVHAGFAIAAIDEAEALEVTVEEPSRYEVSLEESYASISGTVE